MRQLQMCTDLVSVNHEGAQVNDLCTALKQRKLRPRNLSQIHAHTIPLILERNIISEAAFESLN